MMELSRQTAGRTGGKVPRRRRRGLHIMAAVLLATALAALAFFLGPTGHVDLRKTVQANGSTGSVTAGIDALAFAGSLSCCARPGSFLDLTGDVLSLGGGSAPIRSLDGSPLAQNSELNDGAQLAIYHGQSVLEGLANTTDELPFETIITGQGCIVSLAQTGSPGRCEVYSGSVSGKEAVAQVVVAARDTVYRLSEEAEPGQKLAALTFDDGPGTHTLEVLAALATRHVPATFFVLGSSAAAHPEVIAEMKAAGHEIENHTWSHPWLTKLTAEQFASQIIRTNNVIGGSKFLRPPYADSNTTVRALARSMGLRLAFWTVDTRDWERQDVDAIMSHVKTETKPGAIILMHDGGEDRLQTVAAVPVVIDWLFAQGYSLTTIDNIL